MIGPEKQQGRLMAAISLMDAAATADASPTDIEVSFALQVATAAWLGNLTDDAARHVLGLYALAVRRGKPAQTRLWSALVAEYRDCRERLDLCS
jgi:hypothetical protein